MNDIKLRLNIYHKTLSVWFFEEVPELFYPGKKMNFSELIMSYAPILFTSGESLEYNPCKTTAHEISSRVIFTAEIPYYSFK